MSQEKNQDPFITNSAGALPPLAATNFVCQDQGSCNPRFIRATTYTIPNAHDMIKQSHIPAALAISPLADLRSDEVNRTQLTDSVDRRNILFSWNHHWLILAKLVLFDVIVVKHTCVRSCNSSMVENVLFVVFVKQLPMVRQILFFIVFSNLLFLSH